MTVLESAAALWCEHSVTVKTRDGLRHKVAFIVLPLVLFDHSLFHLFLTKGREEVVVHVVTRLGHGEHGGVKGWYTQLTRTGKHVDGRAMVTQFGLRIPSVTCWRLSVQRRRVLIELDTTVVALGFL